MSDLVLLHFFREADDFLKILHRLTEVRSLGCNIAIVEAIEVYAEFLEKFERCFQGRLGAIHRIARHSPFPLEARSAEHIAAASEKRVPIRDGKPEMFSHGF